MTVTVLTLNAIEMERIPMSKSERKVMKIKRMVRTLGFRDRVELMDWLNSWYGEEKRLADLEFQEALEGGDVCV